MRELPRVRTTPPDIDLGPLSSFTDSTGRGVVIVSSGTRFHGFVVRRGEAVHGYVDLCPHAGLPLAQQLDTYMTPDSQHIQCSWHGALFEPETGLCVGGPCAGAALSSWPLHVSEGRVLTA